MKIKTIFNIYLLPHFFPTGLLLILQRLGMVIAIAGFIPACFAKGDNKTAQRHLGAALIKAPTFEQQIGGTGDLAFPAAPKQGLKLAAADLIGVFPHSPAASISFTANKRTRKVTKQIAFILDFMLYDRAVNFPRTKMTNIYTKRTRREKESYCVGCWIVRLLW